MMMDNSRRYRTGAFIWLAELYLKDHNKGKIPITLNDMMISKPAHRIESSDIKFELFRVKVVGERRYNPTRFGYRAQFYYRRHGIDAFCNNRYKSYFPTDLFGEDYLWVVDEKTTVLVDIQFLMCFIDTNTRFDELRDRVCKSLIRRIKSN